MTNSNMFSTNRNIFYLTSSYIFMLPVTAKLSSEIIDKSFVAYFSIDCEILFIGGS